MQRQNRTKKTMLLAACSIILFAACSHKAVFQVNYLLPQAAATYADKQVYVTASDGRSSEQILTPGASKELPDFSGLFSLVVLKSDGIGDLVGAYEVIALIKALCEQRMKASAVTLSDSPQTAANRIEIVLKDFTLDYAERKWVALMRYEAIATSHDGTTRRQMVSGSAERVKLWGRSEAEKLVGELASDVINKLDLEKLLAD